MKTITKTVDELLSTGESPLNLDVIPDKMGINLCSVESLTWTRLDDGQLVNLTVNFDFSSGGKSSSFYLIYFRAALDRGTSENSYKCYVEEDTLLDAVDCFEDFVEYSPNVKSFKTESAFETYDTPFRYINKEGKAVGDPIMEIEL